MLSAAVRLARPHHWIKNVFVLAPVPFALVDRQGVFDPTSFALALLAFCLVNSAVYAFNDVRDAAADAEHPRRRTRPVASGDLSRTAATLLALLWLGAAVALLVAARAPERAWTLVALYVLINLAYSLGAKHVALLDVFLLSSGFVIRVMLGCALVGAPPSSWLLLCTSALALLLGFGKRRADLVDGLDGRVRPALDGYSPAFLSQAMAIAAGIALLSYALYCISSGHLREGRELASLPFVAYGILDYLRQCDRGTVGGSPVELAYRSPSSQACAVLWLIAVTWSLGVW